MQRPSCKAPFCSDLNHKRSLRHRLPRHITRGHLRSVSVQINYLRLLSGGLVASALLGWWRLHLRGIMIMKDPSAVNKHDCNLRRFMKHMRSFSSHRNNINTITITAGEWAPQNMFYKIHIFIAIKSAHFLGPRVKWGKNLRWFMVMLCSAGCGYDRWLMIVSSQPPRFSINTSMFANRIFPAKARVFCSNQFGANQQPMSAPEELRAVWSWSSRCGARVSFSGGDLQP